VTRYWEDFEQGQVYDLGAHRMTREDILDFARRFDPQPFHVDEEAARRGPFGGLIASGWHTASVLMRLYVDAVLADTDSRGSPGMSDLRWLVPVRPGDLLTGRLEVAGVEPSAKHPDRGTAHVVLSLRNQDDETVIRMTGRGLFGRRPG